MAPKINFKITNYRGLRKYQAKWSLAECQLDLCIELEVPQRNLDQLAKQLHQVGQSFQDSVEQLLSHIRQNCENVHRARKSIADEMLQQFMTEMTLDVPAAENAIIAPRCSIDECSSNVPRRKALDQMAACRAGNILRRAAEKEKQAQLNRQRILKTKVHEVRQLRNRAVQSKHPNRNGACISPIPPEPPETDRRHRIDLELPVAANMTSDSSFNNYSISSCSEERNKKPIPGWACGSKLAAAVQQQFGQLPQSELNRIAAKIMPGLQLPVNLRLVGLPDQNKKRGP